MKSKLIILILLITTVVCQGSDASGDTVNKPPNVVFFLVDDLGWSDIGCFGSSFYDTPNIDQLAAEGVRFTDGYATCHVCSPTRASILTGKYPARMNLTDWIPGRGNNSFQVLANAKKVISLDRDETTIAEVLKGLGYETALFGNGTLDGILIQRNTALMFMFRIPLIPISEGEVFLALKIFQDSMEGSM